MAVSRAHINPELLVWARERANFDPEILAKRAGVSGSEKYVAWEQGESRPTHRQIAKVAKALRRPVSLFYLNSPPDEDHPRLEMRRVFGAAPAADSSQLALEIQSCILRRSVVLDLLGRLGEEPPQIPDGIDIHQDPEDIGLRIRREVGVSMADQSDWNDGYEALRTWRMHLDKFGVLSFQMSKISLDEVRGFAYSEKPYPIAVINSTDSVNGRIFTLIHEFAHILLGDSVLHGRPTYEGDDETERWCNRFAASFLIPEFDLTALPQVVLKGRNADWIDHEVEMLGRRYRVSPSAIVRRLHHFRLISTGSFEELRSVFDAYTSPATSGGGDFYRNLLAKLGRRLPEVAFRAYASDHLSARDLSRVMGTKVSNLGELEERVLGMPFNFSRHG